MKIGIFSLQGDFDKHAVLLVDLGLSPVPVRYVRDLEPCEGLIIPGGESTTLTRLFLQNGFYKPVREFSDSFPVLGTCAGMIMMASNSGDPRVKSLDIIDMDVNRNGFGRQVHSFSDNLHVQLNGNTYSIPATFIRAPKVTRVGKKEVTVLANYQNGPVAVQQGNHLALSFHPELDKVSLFHRFLFQQDSLTKNVNNPSHAA